MCVYTCSMFYMAAHRPCKGSRQTVSQLRSAAMRASREVRNLYHVPHGCNAASIMRSLHFKICAKMQATALHLHTRSTPCTAKRR
jgi:hypothetical protein